jgi:hypothetical protein
MLTAALPTLGTTRAHRQAQEFRHDAHIMAEQQRNFTLIAWHGDKMVGQNLVTYDLFALDFWCLSTAALCELTSHANLYNYKSVALLGDCSS